MAEIETLLCWDMVINTKNAAIIYPIPPVPMYGNRKKMKTKILASTLLLEDKKKGDCLNILLLAIKMIGSNFSISRK